MIIIPQILTTFWMRFSHNFDTTWMIQNTRHFENEFKWEKKHKMCLTFWYLSVTVFRKNFCTKLFIRTSTFKRKLTGTNFAHFPNRTSIYQCQSILQQVDNWIDLKSYEEPEYMYKNCEVKPLRYEVWKMKPSMLLHCFPLRWKIFSEKYSMKLLPFV